MHPQRICDELIDALVEVHAVDWRAAGLEGFGKPTGYLERQVRRFTGLWEHNATREIAAIDEVTRWLGEHLPESGPATIVHGDYRLGNVMYSGDRLSAIFDWELATIGDPLADIGYLLATYAQPGDPPSIVASLTTVTRREGFPTRDALVARYEERSGRAMTAVPWYTTLALWKSAIFLEGSYKRRLAGSTDDPFFDRLKDGVPAIAERARQTASGLNRTSVHWTHVGLQFRRVEWEACRTPARMSGTSDKGKVAHLSRNGTGGGAPCGGPSRGDGGTVWIPSPPSTRSSAGRGGVGLCRDRTRP